MTDRPKKSPRKKDGPIRAFAGHSRGVTAALRALPRPSEPDDATLVAAVRDGEEAAFSMLYRRHARAVAGRVYRLLGHDAALDDIVQDTFVHGLRSLDRLEDPSAVRSWLLTIAVRRVHRHLAKQYKHRALSDALREVHPRVGDARARDEVHALYEALTRLAPKLRVPWVLHRIEGQTLPEVAAACDVSLTSVKRFIRQADERLRRYRG